MREDIISNLAECANRLAAAGRHQQAEKLTLDAIAKAPSSQELAKLLEKLLSRSPDHRQAEKAYEGILGLPGLCPDNYYHLAMFHKRRGDYPGMRRALERLLAAGADPVHRYIACCTLDRFSQAFETAESFIGSGRREPVLSRLWHPWGDRSDTLPPGFLEDRLAGLERARLNKKQEPYRTFFRGALLLLLGRNSESAAGFKRLAARTDLPDQRYGWMFFPAGWASLYACDYAGALRMFSRSAGSPVSRSTSLGRMAEIYICTGRQEQGFLHLKKAFGTAAFGELPGLNSWEGQMRLFTGDYKAAVKALTKGLSLGDDVAYCWRGAALTLLGRRKEALRDLDRAVELFPTDAEARVWRAETLRLEGRCKEALPDLDLVISSRGSRTWARINRALVRGALGDEAGMKRDFKALSPDLKKFLQKRPGGAGGNVKRMLEEACRLAKGNRRDDKYFFPVWMK